jgi:hypothetical protein
MSARDALARVMHTRSGDPLRQFQTTCGRLARVTESRYGTTPARWSWCAGCLTVFDDYETPVNPIPEFANLH